MMDSHTAARLRYPFPAILNPHAEAMQDYTNRAWIDGELRGVVPADIADGFKRARTAYMTGFFFPGATWERFIPLARMMVFSIYNDDIYEKAHPDQVAALREITIAVARGRLAARAAGVPLAGLIENVRGGALRFIPVESVDRWADDLDSYFEGLHAETSYLQSGEYPSDAEYMKIREKALMIHPFLSLKEIETGIVLPAEIHEHPVVKRLKSLTVRITGWFNEFQSYDKDEHAAAGNMNFINVLAHNHRTTVEGGRERLFEIHDAELAEFVRLQRDLPDFKEWTDHVANHIHRFSLVISGWRAVERFVHRYEPEAYLNQDQLAASAHVSLSYLNGAGSTKLLDDTTPRTT